MKLSLVVMGKVESITYRKPGGKVDHCHRFKKRPTLARTRDGRILVVTPVRATSQIKDAR